MNCLMLDAQMIGAFPDDILAQEAACVHMCSGGGFLSVQEIFPGDHALRWNQER